MAAQSTLGNLISGVSLLLYRPFRLGDRLQVYDALRLGIRLCGKASVSVYDR